MASSKALLDLERRPDLGELQRDAGHRDIDERAVDRTEVLVRGQQQVTGDVPADPDRHRQRLIDCIVRDQVAPVVAAVR